MAASLLALSWPAVAFERDHEAHEHGHATLDIAVENTEIAMRFAVPAMDIVGFEHDPGTEEQKQRVQDAVAYLEQGDQVVMLSKPTGCELEKVAVHSALLEAMHGKHDHDEHHEDEHDEHYDDAHNDHDEEGHEGTHSEFEVTYHFECDATITAGHMTVNMFDRFASLKEIEAQLITASGQALFELNKDQTEVTW